MTEHREYYHRHLPHWQPQGATFFITFRLKGSLPYEVIETLREEREQEKLALDKMPETERAKQDYLDERRSFGRWDSLLDKAEFGPHWLSRPEIAKIVKEALHYRDRREYDLYAFCIMSNHVHAVFKPMERRSDCQSDLQPDYQSDLQTHPNQSDYQSNLQNCPPLHKIMQSLKRHTARQSNIILGREGAFWQDESYDHVIRDNDEFLRIIHYVLENPVKAGLVSNWEEWQGTYCK